ncbi:MAG: hypothetical protein AB7O59_09340 [Pirellulales bacterium]
METIAAFSKNLEKKIQLRRCPNDCIRGEPVDIHAKRSLLACHLSCMWDVPLRILGFGAPFRPE